MIRLALGKGRNLAPTLEAFRRAEVELPTVEKGDRRLILSEEGVDVELLLLKDADVPLYVAYGTADLGVVGTDVLDESDHELLVPGRFREGHSRLCLIGLPGSEPAPGSQVRLATKYPQTARRFLAGQPWGADVLQLNGSIELAPLLDLAEVILDIVQTGRTLRENGLVELAEVAPVMPCLVMNRASFLRHRDRINDMVRRMEAAEVVL